MTPWLINWTMCKYWVVRQYHFLNGIFFKILMLLILLIITNDMFNFVFFHRINILRETAIIDESQNRLLYPNKTLIMLNKKNDQGRHQFNILLFKQFIGTRIIFFCGLSMSFFILLLENIVYYLKIRTICSSYIFNTNK